MVRTLASGDSYTDRGKKELQKKLKEAREQHYVNLVKKFIVGEARFLLVDKHDVDRDGLLEEIRWAGEFSYKLFSQRSMMQCYGMEEFRAKYGGIIDLK